MLDVKEGEPLEGLEKQHCDEKLSILRHYYKGSLFIIDGIDAMP